MAAPATGSLLERATAVWRERACADFGCDDSVFDSQALTIVPRPRESKEKYIAMAATLGTGTLLGVEESWVEFVRSLEFEKHFRAFQPQEMMLPVVEEARRRGIEVVARNPGLGCLPGMLPSPPSPPAGLRIQRWEREECVPWTAIFHNALGEYDGDGEDFLYALVLLDEAGAPQAMAGAWHESEGLVEIGVDVAREARGRGLAPVIVRALSSYIVDAGKIPTYYCAATNVRSHRTALASGFVPVVSMGGVRPKPAAAVPTP